MSFHHSPFKDKKKQQTFNLMETAIQIALREKREEFTALTRSRDVCNSDTELWRKFNKRIQDLEWWIERDEKLLEKEKDGIEGAFNVGKLVGLQSTFSGEDFYEQRYGTNETTP